MLPFGIIILILVIVLSLFASLFGSETAYYQSNFVLPFDTTNYIITSPYGERNDPINNTSDFHRGIDVVPDSNNIVAIANGTIVASGIGETNGEHVIIEHNISGQIYRSVYYHLKENSRTVQVGDNVKQGQQIGIMGDTGRVTGIHLHFGLYKYNFDKQEFELTDPTIVINNNVSAKEFILFDYDNLENDLGIPDYSFSNVPSYKN